MMSVASTSHCTSQLQRYGFLKDLTSFSNRFIIVLSTIIRVNY